MASHFSQNSSHITSTWEITPSDPLPGLNAQNDVDNQRKEFSNTPHMDLAVQQQNGVVMANPLSAIWPENAVRPEHQTPVPVEEQDAQKTERRRRLTSAKIVAVSSVYFRFIALPEDPMNQAALVLCDDVESSASDVEDMAPGVNQEALLPFPSVLRGWKMETRQRPNGARDKFYSHPTSPRTFRSVIEMVDYIKCINKLEDAEELQGRHNYVNLSEASSSSKGKRKQKAFQDESNFKIRRNFPGDHAKKTPLQLQLEEFFATAHNNLMNLFPTTPEAKKKKTEKKNKNRHISANPREKVPGGLREEGNGGKHQEIVVNLSDAEIEEMINELQGIEADVPEIEFLQNSETQNFQQGGSNPEMPNPHGQAKSIDQRMIDEKMSELYQVAFNNPENLQHPEPPNFLQSGNQQLHQNPQQAKNIELPDF